MDDQLGACQTRWRGNMRVDADKDGSGANERMQRGDKLRHAGHFDPPRNHKADHRTDRDHQHQFERDLDLWSKNGGTDRKGHADDPVPDGALGAFLIGQPA